MKERRFSSCPPAWAALLLVAVLGYSAPATAGKMVTGVDPFNPPQCDETTGSGDECQGGSTGGPNGGPKTCMWMPGQNGLDHLECLGSEICSVAGESGGFGVGVTIGEENDLPAINFTLSQGTDCSPPANPGPQDEIFSYCLRETGDHIGYVLLEVEQPNLVAKIHNFIEDPTSPGTIEIGINNDMVIVDVRLALGNVGRLNKLVCTALKPFRADCLDDFWVIYADSQGHTPTVLSLYTAVDGVSTTEVALEPLGGVLDVTACSDPTEPDGPRPLISPR